MNINNLSLLALLVLLIAGCGGGNGEASSPPPQPDPPGSPAPPQPNPPPSDPDSPAPPPPEPERPERVLSVSGKAIDGYIVGGTVFLDINGNGVLDEDEPSKITEAGGNYHLEIPEEYAECIAYSALVVDVPVGAMDEDLGEVTEPYQITIQPTFEPITEADFRDGLVRDISPLTSVVWYTIGKDYPLKPDERHCHYLRDHSDKVEDLRREIEDAVRGLVGFYNLSADRIYADFIAANDADAYYAAQDIMQGLKAAYARKIYLRQQYPNATDISVAVYRNADHDADLGLDDGWYRNELVYLGTEDFVEHVRLQDTPSLDSVDFVRGKWHELGRPWNDQELNGWISVRQDAYRNADGTYRCANNERVSFDIDNKHYELGNGGASTDTALTPEECMHKNIGSPYERWFHTRDRIDNDTQMAAEIYFRDGNAFFQELPEWINLNEKEDLDPWELITLFDLLGYKFDEEVQVDTAYWRKHMSFGPATTSKYSDGTWTKVTGLPDGTWMTEYSNDGETWESTPPDMADEDDEQGNDQDDENEDNG